MSNAPKIERFANLQNLAQRLRSDLKQKDFVLLYAHNGTGKTRLSMEFKNLGKKGEARDTLYFNAFTEDLFSWDNDLENDAERYLKVNFDSKFFDVFEEGINLDIDNKIRSHFYRYADIDFDKIVRTDGRVAFSKGEERNIKISRGEENLFIWSVFLAICELTLDGDENYNWVKFIYVDDPISSLDENNAIAVTTDLANLVKRAVTENSGIKTVISSHHSLFFNVMWNELKGKTARYFLHGNSNAGYSLQNTNDTPFFHHVALLCELRNATRSGEIKTYHFNSLRSILEKTASFFGQDKIASCIEGMDDEVLYNRALNLLSHGKYSVFQPVDMTPDNKELFKRILQAFLDKYKFELPELLAENATTTN